jgi:hypothetical protein
MTTMNPFDANYLRLFWCPRFYEQTIPGQLLLVPAIMTKVRGAVREMHAGQCVTRLTTRFRHWSILTERGDR